MPSPYPLPSLALASAIPDALIDVAANDPAARILIGGELVSDEGHVRLHLPPNLYGVTVAREGHLGSTGTVLLKPGDRKAFSGQVRPLKSHDWSVLGIALTLVAVGAEAAAIAGHVLADRSFEHTDSFNNFSQIERYGQITAGTCASLALISYVIDGIINRHRVALDRSYRLEAVAWPREEPAQ